MREVTGPESIQGSPEWLAFRVGKRTASVAYTVARGSHAQKIRLARQLKGLEQVYVSDAMARGTQYEPEARDMACMKYNEEFVPKVFVSGNYLASLDGISASGRMIEIKVPASADSDLWQAAKAGEIPLRYQYQLCQQMAVSSAAEAWLCVYLPEEQDLICIRYSFDPAMWDEIQDAWEKFTPYMSDDEPPAPERNDDDFARAVEEYRMAKTVADTAASALEDRRKALIALVGDQNSASGFGCRVTYTESPGAVRWGEIQKELAIPPEVIDKHRGLPVKKHIVTLGK